VRRAATASLARLRRAPDDANVANVANPTTQRTASAINPRLNSFRSDTGTLVARNGPAGKIANPVSPAPSFAILSPNFHPRTCGVGDNSLRLAQQLMRAGYRAEIISRAPAEAHPEASEIRVHQVPGRWTTVIAAGAARVIAREGFSHAIIQYTAHMWGASRLGSPAIPLLAATLRRRGVDVTLLAHELFTPFLPRPDLIAGAALHRAQIALVAAAAHRTFVTTDTRVDELLPFWRAVGRAGRPGVSRITSAVPALPRKLQPGRRRLGVFSTLATTKRFDVVLGAFEQVFRRHADSELVLIGDIGSIKDPRVRAIHDLVARHPGRERIRFSGRLSLADVAREMSELDVYLFPMTTGANTRSSTLPLALETGLPVVAVTGIETDLDLFRDDENLLFAPSMTGQDFGATALRILDDPKLAERLSTGARRLFADHLSWDAISARLLDAILGSSKRVETGA
jgi:glycosyltransferase involved in cell wall biosynthesis